MIFANINKVKTNNLITLSKKPTNKSNDSNNYIFCNRCEAILGFELKYYQKHYPVRHDNFKNRLSITNFYLGNYRGIDLCKINRTAKEIRDGFSLRLVDYDNLDMLISENSSNPRKLFFDRELSELQKVLSKTF